jgi:hypothetical protein
MANPLAGGTRWRRIGVPFRRVIEADIGENRIAEISAREVRPSQIGQGQINADHVGTAEVRLPQISMPEKNPTENCVTEVCIRQVGVVRVGLIDVGMSEVSPIELRLDQCGADHFSTFEDRRFHCSDAAEIGPKEQGVAKNGRSQVGLAQIRFAKAGPEEKGRREVGLLQISAREVRAPKPPSHGCAPKVECSKLRAPQIDTRERLQGFLLRHRDLPDKPGVFEHLSLIDEHQGCGVSTWALLIDLGCGRLRFTMSFTSLDDAGRTELHQTSWLGRWNVALTRTRRHWTHELTCIRSDYGSEGWEFESPRVRQRFPWSGP